MHFDNNVAHLYLLFLIFSLMTAVLTAGIYVFLYQKYKLDLIRHYLYHLAATIFMVFFVALNFYLYLNMGVFDNPMKMMFGYISSTLLFSAPIIYTTPIFSRALVGFENTKKIKLLFGIMSIIAAINGIFIFAQGFLKTYTTLHDIAREKLWIFLFMWFGVLMMFGNIIYSFYLVFRNFRKVEDAIRKLGLKYLALFGFLSVFLVYFDFVTQNHQLFHGQYPVGIFLQPLNLFIFSCISILVLLQAKKFHKQKSESVPQAFLVKYKITDREIEIIEMILSGLSNKEIASKLFLSPSTIRNHISNIFEKTEMPTRGKLLNLIKNSG